MVLTRKKGERILIGDDIVVTILEVKGDGIRLGVDAPSGVRIQRHEVFVALAEANVQAAEAGADTGAVLADLLKQHPAPQPPAA
nr:carbon storage regulator [Galbitalea soli]